MVDKAVVLVLAYVCGSIPTSYWIGRFIYRKDIRQYGSGNVGATNAFRVLGKVPGIVSLVMDILKGYVAVALLPRFFGLEGSPLLLIGLGLAAIAGHTWTIFLSFRGGKGVATSAGVFLALSWQATLFVALVFFGVFKVTRYISAASLSAALVMPLCLYLSHASWEIICFSVAIATLIVIRHRENIRRLYKGTENKI